MRVFLAQTSPYLTHRSWSYLEHLGIGFLEKALANAGFTVDTFDATWEWDDAAAVVDHVDSQHDPARLLGFSVNRSNFESTVTAIRLARRRGYTGHITLGGYFPTFHYAKILTNFPEVDSIVLGHGEYTLTRLCEALANDGSTEDIPGLAYRAGPDSVCSSPSFETEDFLGTVGIPVHRPRYGVARLITSRGCSWACTFCSVNSFDRHNLKQRYLRRDLGEVLAEVDMLVRDNGVHHIWLSDMDFVGRDRHFIEAFCEHVIRQQYRVGFEGDCRVDALDEPLIELLAAAGFHALFLGVESFARRQLTAYSKFPKTVDGPDVFGVVDTMRKHGIVPRFGFIMFDKDTTLGELTQNHEIISTTVGYGTLDSLANRLAVLPGTKLERDYLKDVEHCFQVPIDEYNKLQSHLYYAQYRFRDDRVPFVYEACLTYRNKVSRIQELYDTKLRRGDIDYTTHYRTLWALRDKFAPIFEQILAAARSQGNSIALTDEMRARCDQYLIDFCVKRGLDEAPVRDAIAAEDREPGPRLA